MKSYVDAVNTSMKGYVDAVNTSRNTVQKCGATAFIINGSKITHDLWRTPVYCITTGTNMSQHVQCTAKGPVRITVSVKNSSSLQGGAADMVSWCVG
jgi:hypothetical protein